MKQKKNGKLAVGISILMIAVVAFGLYFIGDKAKWFESRLVDTTAGQTTASPPKATEPQTPIDSEVQVMMIGDDLLHLPVVESGKQKDGSYNFDHLFTGIRGDLEQADLAIINQETILGGSDFKYSGYPMFNSPQEVGDAIVKAGFDVVLHATNHTMDKMSRGIENTLGFWDKYPQMTVLGINHDEQEYNTVKVVKKNGIKIAMLNYTQHLNGISLPESKPWLVNLIIKEKMTKDIKKAKESADVVMVMPHWGTEYDYDPDEYQKELAQFMADQGVDIVIGTHPHVLEPMEWVTGKDGHKMLVYYSLGNYVSCQNKMPRMLGGMAKLTIARRNGTIQIENAGVVPLVTHYEHKGNWNYHVYKLSEYTEALAAKHGLRSKDSTFTLKQLNALAKKVLGDAQMDS